MPGFWTDTRVETLMRLWGEGLSASQIAVEIGDVTRNAVIGKVHRLGLGKLELSLVQLSARKKRASDHGRRMGAIALANGSLGYSGGRKKGSKNKQGIIKRVPLIEIAPSANSLRVSFFDLRIEQCRWPTNVDMKTPEFCGHPVQQIEGRPHYCAHHQWRADRRSEIKCDAPTVTAARNLSFNRGIRVA